MVDPFCVKNRFKIKQGTSWWENGLLEWIEGWICDGHSVVAMDLFKSYRIRVEMLSLQKAPTIQEGEAVTNSNSWI